MSEITAECETIRLKVPVDLSVVASWGDDDWQTAGAELARVLRRECERKLAE